MFYNLLNFSEAPPTDRSDILNSILASYDPDIFMVSELQTEADMNLILNQSFEYTEQPVSAAPFVYNTSGFGGNINQLVFFKNEKMQLLETHQIQTNIRDINHYKFQMNTIDEEILHVFVAHFKASQGDSNVQERYSEAVNFVNYISELDANANIIFGGDFNFYSASEPGFLVIQYATLAIDMLDPLNRIGEWHNNSNYQDVHSQSTRISNNDFGSFGAGGGLDDRFDFIFISDNLKNQSNDIRYIEDTYQAYGNNANCFNDNINYVNCTGDFDQDLRNQLYNMSDHLPVVMSLETDSNFLKVKKYQIKNNVSLINGNLIDDIVDFKFNSSLLGEKAYIYNSLGQKISGFTINNTFKSYDISTYPNGIYMLKITDLEGHIKIIKR
ncbi:endonuclease/exonuclease/phosphatase family protein [Psychroflexus halocasei]|nr:endonuclease/exonuclease/phosphatase family protein [Psychroflexus halocasei]